MMNMTQASASTVYTLHVLCGSYKHRKGPKGTEKDRKDTKKVRKNTETIPKRTIMIPKRIHAHTLYRKRDIVLPTLVPHWTKVDMTTLSMLACLSNPRMG